MKGRTLPFVFLLLPLLASATSKQPVSRPAEREQGIELTTFPKRGSQIAWPAPPSAESGGKREAAHGKEAAPATAATAAAAAFPKAEGKYAPGKQLKRDERVGIANNPLKAESASSTRNHIVPLQCHDPDLLAAFLQALAQNTADFPFSGPRVMSSTMVWNGKKQAQNLNLRQPTIDPRIKALEHVPPNLAWDTGQSFRKLLPYSSYQPGGVPHYFVAHTHPWLNRREEVTEHSCYHLYMDYQDINAETFANWDRIKNRVEVRTGCAIYKTKAQRMQRFTKCIQPILRQIPNLNPESRAMGNFFLGVRQHVGLTSDYNQFTAGNLEPQIAHWARWSHKARSFDEWIYRVLGPDDRRMAAANRRVEYGLLNKWSRPYDAKRDADLVPRNANPPAPGAEARVDEQTYWQRFTKDSRGLDVKPDSLASIAVGSTRISLKQSAQQRVDYTELREQAKRCFDVEGTNDDKILLMDTFRCLPAMYGAPSVLAHGVGNHDHTWFQVAYGQIENEVPVHPTCARLASEQLAHFGGLDYADHNDAIWNKGWHEKICVRWAQSWSTCRNRDPRGDPGSVSNMAQCGLYPACWELAVRRICAAEAHCCPSPAVARACREDSESEACRRGMQLYEPLNPRPHFNGKNPAHSEVKPLPLDGDWRRFNTAIAAMEVPSVTEKQWKDAYGQEAKLPVFLAPLEEDKDVNAILGLDKQKAEEKEKAKAPAAKPDEPDGWPLAAAATAPATPSLHASAAPSTRSISFSYDTLDAALLNPPIVPPPSPKQT